MVAAPARQRNVRVVNRTAVTAAVCVALVALFAVIAVSVVNGRRPFRSELTTSFGAAVTRAAGGRAVAPGHRVHL